MVNGYNYEGLLSDRDPQVVGRGSGSQVRTRIGVIKDESTTPSWTSPLRLPSVSSVTVKEEQLSLVTRNHFLNFSVKSVDSLYVSSQSRV